MGGGDTFGWKLGIRNWELGIGCICTTSFMLAVSLGVTDSGNSKAAFYDLEIRIYLYPWE